MATAFKPLGIVLCFALFALGQVFGQDSLKLELNPEFPGGEAALFEYLANNIKYPDYCRDNGIEGTVYILFVIKKDGTVSKVEVEKGVNGVGGKLMNAEAIRVVETMPNWKPGRIEGKPVNVSYRMPIKFKLTTARAERRALKAKAKEAARLAKERAKQAKEN